MRAKVSQYFKQHPLVVIGAYLFVSFILITIAYIVGPIFRNENSSPVIDPSAVESRFNLRAGDRVFYEVAPYTLNKSINSTSTVAEYIRIDRAEIGKPDEWFQVR